MYPSRLRIILINLFILNLGFVFGLSTQECGLFFGPSRVQNKWICQNSGKMAYYCSPPENPKIPLQNCVPYSTPPSQGGQVATGLQPSDVQCDTARKHHRYGYINCGLLSLQKNGDLVTRAFRCEDNNWQLTVAYDCSLIEDRTIYYEVDYGFTEYISTGV
ncbi:secreted protein [Melampsora americana]|nr:secreted protein [Melampsora americana]